MVIVRKEWILKEYLTRQTLTLGFNKAHTSTSAMSNNDNKSDFNLFNFFLITNTGKHC